MYSQTEQSFFISFIRLIVYKVSCTAMYLTQRVVSFSKRVLLPPLEEQEKVTIQRRIKIVRIIFFQFSKILFFLQFLLQLVFGQFRGSGKSIHKIASNPIAFIFEYCCR